MVRRKQFILRKEEQLDACCMDVLLQQDSWGTDFTLNPFTEKTGCLILSPGLFSHSALLSSSIYINYQAGKNKIGIRANSHCRKQKAILFISLK